LPGSAPGGFELLTGVIQAALAQLDHLRIACSECLAKLRFPFAGQASRALYLDVVRLYRDYAAAAFVKARQAFFQPYPMTVVTLEPRILDLLAE